MAVTVQAAAAHALSTIIVGILVALLGKYLSDSFEKIGKIVPAAVLTILGIWFIYRHYTHHHFHLHPEKEKNSGILWPILIAMFLSPCLEIEGFFFSLAMHGWKWVVLLSVLYFITTVSSMYLWVFLAFHGLKRIDTHKWVHASGIITGIVLVISGLLFLLD